MAEKTAADVTRGPGGDFVRHGVTVAEVRPEDGDINLKFLEASGTADFVLDKAMERRIMRKIDMVLLPMQAITEMLQFLDKTTLSYAALFGIQADTNLHGTDYSWLSSIFYFGYLLSQPFTAMALQRFPPSKCLSVGCLVWSLILFIHAACSSFGGLMAVRFLLGFVEGLTFPAFMLIANTWYPRKNQSFRMGFWFSFNGISQIVGGIMAYGLGHIHSSIESWKWMFLVTGALTTFWSGCLWFLLPNSIIDAKFLTEEEKRAGLEMIRANNTGVRGQKFKKEQFIECLLDPKTWMFFILSFLINIPNAVTTFGTLVLQGFGNTALQTTLLAMPAGAFEFVMVLLITWSCSRFKNARTVFTIISILIALLGSLLMFNLPHAQKVGLLMGYYILYTYPIANLLLFAMVAANTAGHTKKITTNAICIVGYSVGNLSAPQFYKSSQAPIYRLGVGSVVLSLCLCFISYILTTAYLVYLNKKRAATRQAAQETVVENIEFMDLTDKENPLFEYVY